MAKSKNNTNSETVSEYIQKLDPVLAEIIEAIRQIILDTDPEIGEQIKWNSPSFYYTGEMKPFNPKEYNRDLVVLNLYKGYALLVFPSGAKVKDSSGLLEGNYPDGRKIAKIQDLEDLKCKEKLLRQVIKEWLSLVEK